MKHPAPPPVWALAALLATATQSSLPAAARAPATAPAGGLVPVCNAGGPSQVECAGTVTPVQLDGTGSFDPGGQPLSFQWSVSCPNATLLNPTSPTPTVLVDMSAACSSACNQVTLRVAAGGTSASCSTTYSVDDSTPPAISCPPDVTISALQSKDPAFTGYATAVDACSAAPVVTYSDQLLPTTIDIKVIQRTWTADDGCLQASCIQLITVVPVLEIHWDIDPVVCPNPFSLSNGALQGQNLLGTSILGNDLDVSDVDPSTLFVSRVTLGIQPFGPQSLPWDRVRPVAVAFNDDETPFEGPECGCHAVGPDALLDLSVAFDDASVIQAFGLANEPLGTLVQLEIRGKLFDGSPFRGRDCIVITP